ncbi:MAG: methyltransferase [Thermoplasmata archaeon]
MHKFIFELRGPEYDLASAEVRAVLLGLHGRSSFEDTSKYVSVVEMDKSVESVGERLGLTHRVLDHGRVFSKDELFEGEVEFEIPSGSVAVETRRLGGKEADSRRVKRELGAVLAEKNEIDLEDPDQKVLVLISDEFYSGRVAYIVDKADFRERKVKNREFFSPVSLEPWYARALVNLARVKAGDRVHDPFCGTGGLLIEAGMMGLDVSGGDVDEKMVEGCKRNLRQFGVDGEISRGDVSETVPYDVDSVVTDPPYGRAASTGGEDLEKIYKRLFETCRERLREGGYLSTIFPAREFVEMGEGYLELVESYESRVHGSLKRIFCIFSKL